jgi:hypothetical protein
MKKKDRKVRKIGGNLYAASAINYSAAGEMSRARQDTSTSVRRHYKTTAALKLQQIQLQAK